MRVVLNAANGEEEMNNINNGLQYDLPTFGTLMLKFAIGLVVAGIVIISVAVSGCMGIQAPVLPANMMKMDIPMNQNPVQVNNAGVPTATPSTVNQTNVTVAATAIPKFVYV